MDIDDYFSKLGDYYESAGAELKEVVENIHLEEDIRVIIRWFSAHRWSDFLVSIY